MSILYAPAVRDDLKPTLIGTLLIDCTLRQRCTPFVNSLLDCTLLGDRCSAFRRVIATPVCVCASAKGNSARRVRVNRATRSVSSATGDARDR